MIKILITLLLLLCMAAPASALSLEAPTVPPAGEDLMPQETESFSQALWELLGNALGAVRPDLTEAARVSMGIIAAVMLSSLVQTASSGTKKTVQIAAVSAVSGMLLLSARSLIRLGAHTIQELTSYGKLLLPVMTAAMAAQGSVTASTALYAGTAFFDTVLCGCITEYLLPMVYLFLALGVGSCATGEELLKRMRDLIKSIISWCLKTALTIFTTYMGITGVVSGTTDAAALKATRVTISSVVPVVGGILSDASEAVLVSAGLMKNAAGIYGIIATLAILLEPFIRIGAHYLVLKITAGICVLLGSKETASVTEDFSAAMGLMLAMTGSVCLLVLISTICFLKGVG